MTKSTGSTSSNNKRKKLSPKVVEKFGDRMVFEDRMDDNIPVDYNRVQYGYLGHIDLRSVRGRRALAAYANMIDDLGGEDQCSFLEKELVRRLGMMSMQCMEIEEKIVNGDADDTDHKMYLMISKNMSNIMKQTGIKRVMKDVTNEPTDINQYLDTLK